MKKLICFMLVFALIILGGCKSNPKNSSSDAVFETETKPDSLRLLYSYGDSFNPYTASTDLNRNLCTLLYDPLFKVDNNFNCEYYLAQSGSIEGSTATVTLNQVSFSDGTPLTADDVVYSFSLAKKSESAVYRSYLQEVVSCTAADTYTVNFKCDFYDPYLFNLLTFPIIKAGSDKQSNSDGVEIAPVGCGRYTVNENGKTLDLNPTYYGKKPTVQSIDLLNAPDSESISHYVEVGATDIYYTDSSSDTIYRMSGKRAEVNINRLIYIGINSTYGQLSAKEARYAISSAINRTAICDSAFYNNAKPANGYMNPDFSPVKATSSLEAQTNNEITVENLAKLGYNTLDENGFYVNSSGNRLSFSLLVNSDNRSRVAAARAISAQCRNAGIEITVIERTFEQYNELLQSNSFQLYLGEVSILPNMDISALVTNGGSAAYGVDEAVTAGDSAMQASALIASYRNGEISVSDLSASLLSQMAQIPVCFRKGLLFYKNDIKSGVIGTLGDIYYSLSDYSF